jgi:hypothetical protein
MIEQDIEQEGTRAKVRNMLETIKKGQRDIYV